MDKKGVILAAAGTVMAAAMLYNFATNGIVRAHPVLQSHSVSQTSEDSMDISFTLGPGEPELWHTPAQTINGTLHIEDLTSPDSPGFTLTFENESGLKGKAYSFDMDARAEMTRIFLPDVKKTYTMVWVPTRTPWLPANYGYIKDDGTFKLDTGVPGMGYLNAEETLQELVRTLSDVPEYVEFTSRMANNISVEGVDPESGNIHLLIDGVEGVLKYETTDAGTKYALNLEIPDTGTWKIEQDKYGHVTSRRENPTSWTTGVDNYDAAFENNAGRVRYLHENAVAGEILKVVLEELSERGHPVERP